MPITTHGPVPNPLEVLCSPASNINLSKYLLKEIPSQEPRILGKGLQHLGKAQRVKQVPDITLDPEVVAQDQADSCRIIYQFSFYVGLYRWLVKVSWLGKLVFAVGGSRSALSGWRSF